jgi:protein-disulfide isomerase
MTKNYVSNKIFIGIFTTLIILGIYFTLINTNNPITGNTTQGEIELSIGNSPVLGNLDAPVSIYIFSDFSCPFCAAFSEHNQEAVNYLKTRDSNWEAPMFPIIENYVKTGKVKLIWKYFPGHGKAESAQKVGWCLNEQNLFWEFHDKAFENQEKTSNLESMKEIAKELNASIEQLDLCLSNTDFKTKMKEDLEMGLKNKVQGTPTIFINNNKIVGVETYNTLKEIIEKELQ